ncbi:MAG: hypothetical protein U1D30_04940 [Planctomycetota bacterium]
MEAFAQRTELDKATQQQLDRGYRMVELLKQPGISRATSWTRFPALFAGSKGFLDTRASSQSPASGKPSSCSCATKKRKPAAARRRQEDHRRGGSGTQEGVRKVLRAMETLSRVRQVIQQRSERSRHHGQDQGNCQTPKGDPQYPEDHPDDGAHRHRPLQEGDGPGRPGGSLHAKSRNSSPI